MKLDYEAEEDYLDQVRKLNKSDRAVFDKVYENFFFTTKDSFSIYRIEEYLKSFSQGKVLLLFPGFKKSLPFL